MVTSVRAGGYQRLLRELLDFDLSTVDLRHIPKTEALLDQKIASLSPENAWWLDILRKGQLPHNVKNAAADTCPGQMLYDDYIEHARKTGALRRQIETALGIYLGKIAPGLSTKVETFVVQDAQYRPIAGAVREPPVTNRGTVYTFPPLTECRKNFEEKIHQSMAWPDGTDWSVQQT